jgi:hypothetical protein
VGHSLAIVCAFGLLLVGACGGAAAPSSASTPATNSPGTNSVTGAPLALGTTVRGTTDAKYHFTSAGAYRATWIARWKGAAGGCQFSVVITDDMSTLTASSLHQSRDPGTTGVLAGSAVGPHAVEIKATGCEWELSVV